MFRCDSRVLLCLLLLCAHTSGAQTTAAQTELFESQIRPVLIERCYHCHNSSEDAQGGLALDYRDGLLKGGDNGPVVVPGKPAQSRLLPILRHDVDGLEMPEDSGKLSDEVVAAFEQWIRMGAPDPRDKPPSAEDLSKVTSWESKLRERRKWWSFQPIQDPLIPAVANQSWSRHPIDRFILSGLERAGLEPATDAAPAVLVRRVYFALTGLPPTVPETKRWVARIAQERDSGMRELVDHLLDSPHFGERWARHWMDWIRYAESHGSEGDPRIDNAYLYRNYLIRALNADVPWNQLVREHIAGDLLEQPRINRELGINESAIGPAHLRMVFHGFAPTDALDEKVRFTDDQINTFSKAFLGITVSCARCHDHKFDAISQKDYYALFGIFGSTRPARTVIDVPAKVNRNRTELQRLKPAIRTAVAESWRKAVPTLGPQLLDDDGPWKKADKPASVLYPWFRLKQLVAEGRTFADAWSSLSGDWQRDQTARAAHRTSQPAHHWRMSESEDYATWFPKGSGLPRKPQPAGTFTVAPDGDAVVGAVLPAGVYSHSLSRRHAARLTSPTVLLDGEYDVWIRALGGNGAATRYVVQNYPRNGTVFPVTQLRPQWQWHRFSLKYWDGDRVHLELATAKDAPLLVKNQANSWFGLREAVIVKSGQGPPQGQQEFLDPLFAIDAPPASFAELAEHYTATLAAAVNAWHDGAATDAQALLLDRCAGQGLFPNSLDALSPESRRLVRDYRRLEQEIVEPTRVPGLDETLARDQPLYERGNHRRPTDAVPRRFLEAIDATPYATSTSGRRRLAEDVLRSDNPLSRRVIVNRVWHHLLGRGIVATPDNFGRLGERPSHPKLLDHLATRFATDMDWSLKSLIREIVLSRTWQMSSASMAIAAQKDPGNSLLSHANIRRLEAEAIRDSLLAVSGRLDRTAFGGSVGGNSQRRSVYVQVIRNSLDPFLRAFDFPEPFSCTGRRDATNVPAQSLMLMNDPSVSQHAAAWAESVVNAPQHTDQQRVDAMFLTAFARPASESERSEALQYLRETRAHYRAQREGLVAIQQKLQATSSEIQSIRQPVRERLEADAAAGRIAPAAKLPEPTNRWEFETNLRDTIGSAHGTARQGAAISDGAVVVRRGGHVVTAPLDRTFREKTLEAWVQLDNLKQRAGGVMTIQTKNGATFDAIVFAEQAERRWLAGSNNFARTQPFANAPAETEAAKRPVHLAIAYHADGRVIGYRDGQPYGKGYKTRGVQEFKAGESVVSFGVRHLPATGNRLLSGRILRAQLYDKALSAEQIAATAASAGYFVSDAAVLAELSAAERKRIRSLEQSIKELDRQVAAFGNVPDPNDQRVVWADLARAMFTFKEFIYLR